MNCKFLKGLKLGLVGLALLLFVPRAYAGELRTGDKVIVAAGEILEDDLYVTAVNFVLDGT